ELVHEHVSGLANSKRAICRLILDRGIPPAVVMHHMRSRGQVQSYTPGLERKHDEGNRLVLLEATNQTLAPADLGPAVEKETEPRTEQQSARIRPQDTPQPLLGGGPGTASARAQRG